MLKQKVEINLIKMNKINCFFKLYNDITNNSSHNQEY